MGITYSNEIHSFLINAEYTRGYSGLAQFKIGWPRIYL